MLKFKTLNLAMVAVFGTAPLMWDLYKGEKNLEKAHEYRENYYNNIFNLVMGFLLVAGLSLWLAFLYRGKLSPEEKKQREQKKKQDMLDMINRFHDTKLKEQQNLLNHT